MWSEDNVSDLIELYRQHSVLWDVEHKDYKNRSKKHDAIRDISTTLECDMLEVERKITVLMAQFRKTRKKIQNMKKSGMEDEDIERNTWYGYKQLMFLADRIKPNRAKNSGFQRQDNIQQSSLEDQQDKLEMNSNTEAEEEIEVLTATSKEQPRQSRFSNRKRKINVSPKNSMICPKQTKTGLDIQVDQAYKIMTSLAAKNSEISSQKDEYSLYGEQIACKLRNMDAVTRLETQHHINCIIYKAEMNKLKNLTLL